MAIKPAGSPLSLSEIQAEFGGSNPISLSEYYRGGGLVPNGPAANNGIATSGAIGMGGFYGAVNRVTVNITISAHTANYVLNTAKAAGYLAGVTDVVLNIDPGIYVYSSGTGSYALDVDTSWAAGDTIRINNLGVIAGMGGGGGNGESVSGTFVATYSGIGGGAPGGGAFRAQRAVAMNNDGTIAGGGGGGGGGGGAGFGASDAGSRRSAGGGGGGGGRSGLTNSGAGSGGTSTRSKPGAAGGVGTNSSQGGGGAGGVDVEYSGGAGGSGGGWGTGGATGVTSSVGRAGAGGGAAGAAVAGNGNITWVSTGTRLGAIA